MGKPKSHSIVTRVTATLITLVMASLLVAGGMLIYLSSRSELRKTFILEKSIAHVAAVQINAYLEDLNRKITYLARVRGLTTFDETTMGSLLEALLNQNMAYKTVGLVDRRGMLLQVRSSTGEVVPEKWVNTTAFRRSFRTQEDYIGPVEVQEGRNEPTMLLSVPIRDAQNKVDGILFARISLTYLWSIVDGAKIGESGYAYLLDRRGFLMMESGGPREHFAFADLMQRPVGKAINDYQSDVMQTYRGLHDTAVLGQQFHVEIVNWTVVVEMPMSEVYAPAYRLTLGMAACLLVSLVISALLGLMLSRRISIPLQQLVSTVGSIRLGELEKRAVIFRNDEIGILADAFNRMAEQLRGCAEIT